MRRAIGIVAALIVLVVLFWLELSGDPSISQTDLWLSLGTIAVSLGLVVALQETSRLGLPLSQKVASWGQFLGVVILLLATALLRTSSVNIAGSAVLCLGLLAGTLVTLGVLDRGTSG